MQQFGGIRLDEQAALEIDAGRKVVIGVGRPSEAVDAAMLTAPIGVDRTIEADVRRRVPGQNGLGLFDRDGGAAFLVNFQWIYVI